MAPHSSTLAWKIPWMEESCLTEQLHFHFSLSCIGEGNGNLLQCSYLENPRDRGACWAVVFGRDWHDLAAAWVKIREIERLNQSKWLKPVRALGFRKKGLAFARDSSLTPKWDVNSGCSNKKNCGSKGQRRRRFSGNELRSEREPVQEKADATVSHWFLTSRGQAEWMFDSILSKKSLFPRQRNPDFICGIPSG